MGKKAPLFISTLLAFAGSLSIYSPVTYAEDNTVSHWTVSELLAAKPILDTTKDNFCGDKWECREGISMAYRGLGGRAGGQTELESLRFMITSLNPTLGTIKAIYFDEDLDYDLTEFHMYWLDPDMPNPNSRASYYYDYHENIKNREDVSGLHVLVVEDETNRTSGWFVPNQEITYEVGDFTAMTNNTFHVYIDSERGNSIRTTNYTSCLESPEYQPGMECRLVYNNDIKWFDYIPMTPERAEQVDYDAADLLAIPRLVAETVNANLFFDQEPAEPLELAAASEGENDNTLESDTPASNIEISSLEDATILLSSSRANAANNRPSAPETGVQGDASCAEPFWWFAGIIGVGILSIIWLFWPNKHHASRRKI